MGAAVRSRLFSEPIAVISVAETVGDDGRATRSESVSEVYGAIRHRVTIDGFSDGVVATDELVAYLPADTPVSVGDRMTIRDLDYEVVSTTFPQINFRTGEAHHVEVRGRRSTR